MIPSLIFRLFLPDKSERHYIEAGRIFGAFVIFGTAFIAMQFESLFEQIKFLWEFNVVFGASFWLGMLWRRANRMTAWISVLVTLIAFFIVPIFAPVVMPGLRTNVYLARTTDPQPLVRTYIARAVDVEARENEIALYESRKAQGMETGPRPEPLTVGKPFTRTYKLPPRSIFWTDGIKVDDNGIHRGNGRLNADLLVIDALGFDLSNFPNALNETIRALLRLLTPFLIILILGLVTKPDDERMLDRFYAKMKTPVIVDRKADNLELEKSYANPHRFDHLKVFPYSNWEFCRWDRIDSVGFGISVLIAFAIIGTFFVVVNIGG